MSSTVRPGPDGESSAKPQPGDATHGTLVLEHAYHIEQRLESGAFFATYAARQTPFGRPVQVRFYGGLEELQLPPSGYQRVRAVIERGGDGDLAIDVGELEGGAPFLVLPPPSGEPLAVWWRGASGGAGRLRGLLGALLDLLDGLAPAQRRELATGRLRVEGERGDGAPRLRLWSLGELPTRAEVRQMEGLVTSELCRGFPPECFLPAGADTQGLEDGPAADVWRVGAVVYELLTGRHPLFAEGADVAECVAELVAGLRDDPAPPASGDARLDEALKGALRLEAGERWRPEALRGVAEGGAASPARGTPSAALGLPAEGSERGAGTRSGGRGSGLPRLFRVVVAALALVLVAMTTYLATHQPPSTVAVIITSEPAGVAFERVGSDGEARSLGRTPILLADERPDAPLRVRPVYEDGQVGDLEELAPEQLELFDACRRLHVRFE